MTTDRFLSRWMRRKAAARHTEAVQPVPPKPVRAADASAPGASAVPGASPPRASEVPVQAEPPVQTELPTLDSLQGLVSEYRGFMHTDVDPNMQRAALKKLFSDPHFNIMDGLDVYIDDYGIPDPIPADMLASLNQAQGLLFDRIEEEPELAATVPEQTSPATEVELDEGGGDVGEAAEPALVAQQESMAVPAGLDGTGEAPVVEGDTPQPAGEKREGGN